MADHRQHESAERTAAFTQRETASAPPEGMRAYPAAPAVSQMVARVDARMPMQRAVPPARPNRTGLPGALKNGIEALSGMTMDDVRVHRSSPRPARIDALAYTQGSEIYLGPGQERHLAHEAWHVVQQKQGRVRQTLRVADVAINDDARLEAEADTMSAVAARPGLQLARTVEPSAAQESLAGAVAQRFPVDVKRDQKLIQDTPGGKLGGTNFEWLSKFEVTIENDKVVVTIRLKANIDPALFQEVWANHVAKKWSDRFMLQFEGKNYPIVVQLLQVAKGEHYSINVSNAESALGSGARGHFGTQDMTTWGKHDTTNIAHEVGHMLGNVDEYGIVEFNGLQYDYLKNPSTTIMGVSKENPVDRHYYLIKWAAEHELCKNRSVVTTGNVIPYVARVGASPSQGSGVSMQEMLGVKLKPTKPSASQSSGEPQPQPSLALKPPSKPLPKPDDATPPKSVIPVTAKPKPAPKIIKDVVEQPSELEQIFARRRQLEQSASSVPKLGGSQVQPPLKEGSMVVSPQPQGSTPKLGGSHAQPLLKGGSVVVSPQPLGSVSHPQAPKLGVPQADAPKPRIEVTADDIRSGREIIDECYAKALEYVENKMDNETLSKRITAEFKQIARRYAKADPNAADFAETLQACVKGARAIMRQYAPESGVSAK